MLSFQEDCVLPTSNIVVVTPLFEFRIEVLLFMFSRYLWIIYECWSVAELCFSRVIETSFSGKGSSFICVITHFISRIIMLIFPALWTKIVYAHRQENDVKILKCIRAISFKDKRFILRARKYQSLKSMCEWQNVHSECRIAVFWQFGTEVLSQLVSKVKVVREHQSPKVVCVWDTILHSEWCYAYFSCNLVLNFYSFTRLLYFKGKVCIIQEYGAAK